MSLDSYIRSMPKVELHVHLEGSIRPETLLKLANRNHVALPADSVEGLKKWYTFTDFPHFIQVYATISSCLRTASDIELIAREFLSGQAAQNIVHSEVTYTAFSIFRDSGISFDEQLAAINRARAWAERELGVSMTLTIDIPRERVTPLDALVIADWAISGIGNGVTAFGVGGPEVGFPPELFSEAFDKARAAGLASVPHAGETVGPESIWGALRTLRAERIGHGVRCLEDAELVKELRDRQIPLEVCPTSNVCLKVFPSLAEHPLPHLLAEGLYVTINSDDPPMFNTTLTEEFISSTTIFNFSVETVEKLSLNALRASLLPHDICSNLEKQFEEDFKRLRIDHEVN